MLWKPIADEWSATEAPRWRIVAHEPHTALGAAGAVIGAGLLLTLFADGVPATMETIAFPLVAYGCVTAMGVSEVLKRFAGTWDREARFEKDAIVVTDNKGRTVDFRNTIIIMTSNVGSRAVIQKSVHVGYSTTSKSAVADRTPQSEYRKALEQTFAPEFLNRIDDIILFRTLEIADVERIIELELQGLLNRTKKLGYKVKITEGAKRRLATMGYESRYGVRSLKRTLMDNVEEPLSSLIIDGKLHEGDTVVVESDKAHGVKLRVA